MPKKQELQSKNNWFIAYLIFILLLIATEGLSERTISWIAFGLAVVIGVKTYDFDVFIDKKKHKITAKIITILLIALLLFAMAILYYRLLA